jgi:hypothetical protein
MAMLICHRWFSSGEGWAWSDGIAGSVRKKVLDVLRKNLPALREVSKEPRDYTVPGGTVVVRTMEDPECPDPLARSRHPVLVAAVFIPGARPKDVSRRDAEELFSKAEQACRGVVAPGGTSGLELHLPETLANIIRRRRTMKYIGLLAAFAVIVGGCIAFAQVGKQILRPEADEKDISAWASAAEEQLDRWGVEVEQPKAASAAGDTQSGAVSAFLALLCRNDQWEQLDSGHVDGEYLSRLPKSAFQLDRNPKESDVRSAMTGLLNDLGAKRAAKEEQREPKAVIADIAGRMDYRHWYTGDARTAAFNGRAQGLPEEQRRYIYRFCPTSTGLEDGGLCKALYQIMTSQWGVKGLCEDDLRQRPWFVAGCFFEFASLAAVSSTETASQPTAAQSTGDSAKRTASAALQRLRKYLPEDSLLGRADLRRDNLDRPIKAAIRALARRLDVPTSGRDDRTILQDVRVRLKQIAESALETASSEDLPESTRWYLERLACPGPAPTSKPVEKGTGE